MRFAWVMLAFYGALALLAIYQTVRALMKPVELSERTIAAAKTSLRFSLVVFLPALAVTFQAFASRQYYLLMAAAMLFTFGLPILVFYLRIRSAQRKQLTP